MHTCLYKTKSVKLLRVLFSYPRDVLQIQCLLEKVPMKAYDMIFVGHTHTYTHIASWDTQYQ